jgi:hypothetical protein
MGATPIQQRKAAYGGGGNEMSQTALTIAPDSSGLRRVSHHHA